MRSDAGTNLEILNFCFFSHKKSSQIHCKSTSQHENRSNKVRESHLKKSNQSQRSIIK